MIGAKEAEGAVLRLIHPEIAHFELDEFVVQVVPDKFVINSRTDYPEHARDLVVTCFGEHVTHTPITALGINRSVHFHSGSIWIRNRVGRRLAPKEPWGEWGQEIEYGDDSNILPGHSTAV